MKLHVSQLLGQDGLLPEQMSLRSAALDRAKSTLEGAGYLPMETPTLYFADALLGQGGNEEFAYILTDSLNRKVVMPYDLTLPLFRYVALHSDQLPFPFKRYQIQRIWRQNPNQPEFINELYRCDVDVIGTTSLLCEAEILKLLTTTLKQIGMTDFSIRFNFLPLLQQLKDSPLLETYQKPEGTNTQTLEKLKPFETTPIQQLLHFCSVIGVSEKTLKFDPSLTRSGWQYYSGLIFEVSDNQTVLCEGGRYEHLCKMAKGQSYSGVGMTFYLDTIMKLLEQRDMPLSKFAPQVLVTLHANTGASASLKLYRLLLEDKVQTELFFDSKSFQEQLAYAKRKQIPFLVFQESGEDQICIVRVSTGKRKKFANSPSEYVFLGVFMKPHKICIAIQKNGRLNEASLAWLAARQVIPLATSNRKLLLPTQHTNIELLYARHSGHCAICPLRCGSFWNCWSEYLV